MESKEKEEKRSKVLKFILRKAIRLEREVKIERNRKLQTQSEINYKINLDTDLLRKKDIENQYRISQKTIDRMRIKGLKSSQNSSKGIVWILRKDLEDFLKKDRYDR